ncbi:MAG: hypothetical protein J6X59_06290 [Bacteroidales bacterium]|nr:hypothetical protein [Bacteroidales bacterium]
MKHTAKFFTLLAAILTFAACDKDKDDLRHERDIVYTVAEQTTSVHLTTEAEWQQLLDRFCDYAEGGSSVTFRNAQSANKSATKDATTFSTTDREAMKRWMAQMEDEGMTVTVTYDSQTGTWNGTAYANATSTNPDCITYATPYPGDAVGVIMTFDTANHVVYITTGNLPGQTAVHFPIGKFRYFRSSDQLLLHDYYSINTSFEVSFTIAPAGGDTLDLTYNYVGNCPADNTHIHHARLVPTTQYTTLHCCTVGSVSVTLHIDRTNNDLGFGQSAVCYGDTSMYTNPDRPFSNGRFSYALMDLGDYGFKWNFLFQEDNLGEIYFDIENPGSNLEIWHRWTEGQTSENHNPLRDFGFERIN